MKVIKLTTLLILLAVSRGIAQHNPNPKMFVGSQVNFPITTLSYKGYSDSHQLGGGVSGGFDFQVFSSVNFRTSISYNKLRFDEQSFAESTDIQNSGFVVDGGTETLFGLIGDIKYRFRNWFPTPYIITGVGAYRLTHRNIHFPEQGSFIVSEKISYWAPSLKIGTGIDFNAMGSWGLFTEVNFVINFPEPGDNIMHVPVTLGVTF
jgi:opacity protein-like surface antigen